MKDLLALLPDTERIVLSLYYFEGFTIKEIGNLLRVTDSRISQIKTRALTRIRKILEQ
jgi:RNA polymerase sigma factor for flagellar operon FliA